MISREQLELLLLDRALGGWTPEVAALLDAYLEKDDDARHEAERWGGLVGKARAAITEERAVLPPFPLERWTRRERLQRAWRVGAVVSGMAACLAAGMLAGPFWKNGGKAPIATGVAQVTANLPAQAEAPVGVQDFWSVARMERYARQNGGVGAVRSRSAAAEWLNQVNPFGGVQ